MGYTVGRWEGDTLVLDSIGFSDETWLGRGGFFHSDQMRVVEKFTRTGNQILYEVTVEDPEVLVKPWVMPSRTLRLSSANTIVAERGSCTESELSEVSSPDAALVTISRQSLLKGVVATGAAAIAGAAQRAVRVAAVQLHPVLGDVSGNLERAEQLIREAIRQRAEWIALPEFFT